MKKAKILKMKHPSIPGSDEIGTLIMIIMQPAIAGGITKKRAGEIYDEIMSSIAIVEGKNDKAKTAFEILRDDILFKWYQDAMKKRH